eukprot:4782109-Lingulodinium_polyedra.AAC.1
MRTAMLSSLSDSPEMRSSGRTCNMLSIPICAKDWVPLQTAMSGHRRRSLGDRCKRQEPVHLLAR